MHIISGDLAEAETYNRLLHEMGVSRHYAPPEAWSAYLQGLIHLYRYELDGAIQHLKRAVEQRFTFDTRAAVDSIAGLLFAYQVLGRPESAISWLETSAPGPAEVMLFWLEIPSVTRCRALIVEGSAVNLREAEERLQEYAELNEAHHNTCQLIGILSLQAMAFEKRHKHDEACAALERALTLARPGGFIFPFLELGPPMADLLNRLIKKNVAVDYIEKLLAAFRGDEHVAVQDISGTQEAAPTPSASPQPLVEPLTNRELEVLELLVQRRQNKEIADKLFISTETVKSHLKNIYQKLQVRNRRQAVTTAKSLGLLSGR
jgi:LuxR family maltose regulon positive regulatory protein